MLHVQKAGPVLTLTLNRPEKRNALHAALVTKIRHALSDAADDNTVRVIVLTGAGRTFSAGADLAALQALQTATNLENQADSAHLAALFEQIYTHPKPIIAKVNGHAIAGGAGLAAVCDFAIANDKAKIGFTETRIGFVPAIVMVFVLRKLGETQARNILLRGHLITMREAENIGLITRAVADTNLDQAVEDLALELATQTSGSALMLTKKMLAHVRGMGLNEALQHAIQTNAFARGTEDCKAGVSAFLEKRDPPWRS